MSEHLLIPEMAALLTLNSVYNSLNTEKMISARFHKKMYSFEFLKYFNTYHRYGLKTAWCPTVHGNPYSSFFDQSVLKLSMLL